MISKFDAQEWCKEHSEHPHSKLFVESFADRKKRLKRWRLIDKALEKVAEEKEGREEGGA